MTTKRVWHPTLDSFEDVPENRVDEWVDAGWRKTQPKHATAPEFAPGEHPGVARVPVLEDVSRSTSVSGSTATSSTATGTTSAT